MQTVTPAAGVVTIDQSRDNVFIINMNADVSSVVFSNNQSKKGQYVELHFVQDGTGGRALTGLPSSVTISGGSFALSKGANKRDVLAIRQVANAADAGGVKYGEVSREMDSGTVAQVRSTTAAYAATVTPNADTTDVLNIGALTGNITIANPTGTPRDGQHLRMRLVQDATGSRTVTFGSGYAFGTDVTAAMVPSAANAKFEANFVWNAADSKWRAASLIRGF